MIFVHTPHFVAFSCFVTSCCISYLFYGQIVILTAICNLWRFNMANLQLAKNLFYLRTISGLKQDDIADIFNISRQACSNYETSTRTPDLVIWLLLLHFSRLWISLSSVISKPNILFPTRNILPACARRLLLICRESKKIPVTTSISPKKKWILYSHSVLLPMRSVNSLPVSSLR